MRRQEQQSYVNQRQSNFRNRPASDINQDGYHQSLKLNQHLLTQTSFLLLLLSIISILNNGTKSYDFNIVIAVGIYFLSTVNPFLYKMVYFYVLVGLTIFADGIVISLLNGKVSVFHSFVFPIIQIILKIGILVLQGLRWVKQVRQVKHQEQRGLTKQQIEQLKRSKMQQQKNKKLEQQRYHKYMQQKRLKQKPIQRSKYYYPINQNATYKQDYSGQQYRQFYNLQYDDDIGQTQRPKNR